MLLAAAAWPIRNPMVAPDGHIIHVPLKVSAPAVIAASALSSARRKLSAAAFRLMAGKEAVVPPSCIKPNAVPALLPKPMLPAAVDPIAERPVKQMLLVPPATRLPLAVTVPVTASAVPGVVV